MSQRGVALVEVVIAIVVVGIALGGALLALNRSVGASADPMIQHQAVAIAEAYLEERLPVPYAALAGLSHAGARDQEGNPVAGLESYTVDLTVTAAVLGGAPAQRLQVSVSHPSLEAPIVLSSYRTAY